MTFGCLGCVSCIMDENAIALANKYHLLRYFGLYWYLNISDRALYTLNNNQVKGKLGLWKSEWNRHGKKKNLWASKSVIAQSFPLYFIYPHFHVINSCIMGYMTYVCILSFYYLHVLYANLSWFTWLCGGGLRYVFLTFSFLVFVCFI